MFASDRFTGGVRKRVSLQVGDMHVCWCSFWYNFREYMLLMGIVCIFSFLFLTLLPVLSVDPTHSPLVMPNIKYMQIDEI